MYHRPTDSLLLRLAVVSTLCLSVTLASTHCNYHGTPHPRGYCGQSLVNLHRNVCNVLRRFHPEYFSNSTTDRKRSLPLNVHSQIRGDEQEKQENRENPETREKMSRELQALDELLRSAQRQEVLELEELMDKVWSGYKEGEREGLRAAGELRHWQDAGSVSDDTRADVDLLSEILQGRNKREASTAKGSHLARRKRDLVCDCCYNQCSVSDVVLYC
ncbi:hypothetical protein EGW08_021662 [Elysia chlorotica]|uniref:Insulin-like domain-containing protein n=1 Tax=Elysia chlorotica TaxID=188477 RepID=A0A3S1BML3_ELYCH|nr:hypothetical protein EGW08_021662 [Elysia chlorotica]